MPKLTPIIRSKVFQNLVLGGGTVAAALAGALLVAPNEGLVLETYKDPVGIVTSCYGHTGPELKMGQKFTQDQCDAQLAKDLEKHEKQLDQYLKVPTNVYQKAALIDFTYNVGIGNVRSSTLLKKFNSGQTVEGCEELTKWVYAGGRKMAGLVKRREEAMNFCLGKVDIQRELSK